MLELSLLRHGQTDYSRENRFCGSIDPSLNDVGQRMAQAVGAGWKAHGFTAIWCSPATRTQQTVAPLAAATGLEPHLDEGLREIHYGDWESMRHEEVKARWPDAYTYWAADPASRGTPGGETAFHVAARSAPVIERIRVAHPEGRVLNAGKSTAFCEAEARDETGKLLSKAIGTFKLLPEKKPA